MSGQRGANNHLLVEVRSPRQIAMHKLIMTDDLKITEDVVHNPPLGLAREMQHNAQTAVSVRLEAEGAPGYRVDTVQVMLQDTPPFEAGSRQR